MKEYELWLDESGDFEGETQANRRFVPSLAGGILIADGLSCRGKKRIPGSIYLAETCFIMTVYLVTTFATAFRIYEGFSFAGGFMFLHAVDPLVFMMVYLFDAPGSRAGKKYNIRYTLLAPAFIAAYLVFDLIRWLMTGSFVYGLIPESTDIYIVLIFGGAACVLESVLGAVLLLLKNRISSRLKYE